MNRRTFLASGGVAMAGGIAGCLGESDQSAANEFDYETDDFSGVAVPLAPIDDVYEWFQNDEARFVDARGRGQYDSSRIEGAVFSPAEDGLEENDPVEEWDTDTRIVTYCNCPHHLSGLRASSLISDGYTHSYAIDEGFGEWYDRDYPMEGTDVLADMPAYEVRGQSSSTYAGEYVWVSDTAADQVEIAPIQSDGSYEMTLHFTDLSSDSVLELEAPDYAFEATLAELTSGVVTGQL
ncbi:rhodanese-like domain-containing protein [Halomontanus rarus]|uniref:rhodanese-like domain-containing protein n=1 Tax=Halomontanus rarus TaxID=3034020 RepID=UPI0023E8B9A5|nr:rhodanese-like domain-containing protein [Halovivax sp. TS33]